jgi:hypothetical protein
MAISIEQPSDKEYIVNNISIYLDSSGNWVAREELTTIESKAFRSHLKAKNRE